MFNVASSLLLVALALNAENAFGTNQHLTCTAVDCVYSDGTPGQAPMRREALQGPPGKRGQTGVKGEPGVPGSNGEPGLRGLVDPQDIENVVKERVTEVIRGLHERIETLEGTVSELKSTVQDLHIHSCNDEGGFYYKTKCYNVILHTSADITYANARELCTTKGETLADILNVEHQSMIADYVRMKTSRGVDLWLGMSYRTSNKTLRFSNGNDVTGDVAASFRWWSGYPTSTPSSVGMAVFVTSTSFGIFNIPVTSTEDGVLCEK